MFIVRLLIFFILWQVFSYVLDHWFRAGKKQQQQRRQQQQYWYQYQQQQQQQQRTAQSYQTGSALLQAYKTLGVTSQAADAEVRQAYRSLALLYHPDRVANLGEDVKRTAEKKLQELNAARDLIFKVRGLK